MLCNCLNPSECARCEPKNGKTANFVLPLNAEYTIVNKIPHRCPICDGKGNIHDLSSFVSGQDIKTCPACKGACVLWG